MDWPVISSGWRGIIRRRERIYQASYLPWPGEDNEAEPKRPIEEVIEEMVAKLVGTRSEETLAQEDPDSDQ